MLYLVKRVLPFMLTFAVGIAFAGLFSFSSEFPVVEVPTYGTASSKTSCFAKKTDEVHASARDLTKLQILSKPRPGYTALARENNTEGTVVLRVTFLPSGKIGSIEPVKSLPDGLTEQAIEAARRIRFEAPTVDGQPMTVVKSIEYTFSIY